MTDAAPAQGASPPHRPVAGRPLARQHQAASAATRPYGLRSVAPPVAYARHPVGAGVVAKSALDRVGALLLLVVLGPIIVFVAVVVALSSPGPVLYRQRRVGRDGEMFEFLKFRTMVPAADAEMPALDPHNEADGLLFKIQADPRVTAAGRWLRRLSLDELPQLWNVLRGEMSLVGPRPLPVDPTLFLGHERVRLLVKPGITGLWQVSGRSELTWAQTVHLDTRYVTEWSFLLDVYILLRTPLAVLRGRGAW